MKCFIEILWNLVRIQVVNMHAYNDNQHAEFADTCLTRVFSTTKFCSYELRHL